MKSLLQHERIYRITVKQAITLLEREIKWCEQNPMPDKVTPEFRKGFISGLEQAILLLASLRG